MHNFCSILVAYNAYPAVEGGIMKIKQRTLALILSMAMVLTYMPVMAFAASSEEVRMNFSPSSITVYSEDIKNPSTGRYDLYMRNKLPAEAAQTTEDGRTSSPFADGDVITLSQGSKSYAFKYYSKFKPDEESTVYDIFYCPELSEEDNYYYGSEIILSDNARNLVPGKTNTVTVDLVPEEVTTTINVFVDTPQLREQRKAAAEEKLRQGTLNTKLPRLSGLKVKVGKKSATIRWKKLSKKQLKKGKPSGIEVWVCRNKDFAKGATVERTVKKTKSSVKIKLSKGTYYVKVRTIKKVGEVKYVGRWTKAKKFKVKK